MHDTFESIAALDALGAATDEEARDLRDHLAGCVPCRRARDDYAAALTAFVTPVAPPPVVRARVMEAVTPPARRISPWWLATAATLFLALWGWRELGIRVEKERVRTLAAENGQLRDDYARLSRQFATWEGFLADQATRMIALTGQEVAPSASAKMFLNENRRFATVYFFDLPPNPADKSYQLWIIRGDQPLPVSAAVFTVTPGGSAQVTIGDYPVDTPTTLAVTLEPKGGVEQPTNTRFFVSGKT